MTPPAGLDWPPMHASLMHHQASVLEWHQVVRAPTWQRQGLSLKPIAIIIAVLHACMEGGRMPARHDRRTNISSMGFTLTANCFEAGLEWRARSEWEGALRRAPYLCCEPDSPCLCRCVSRTPHSFRGSGWTAALRPCTPNLYTHMLHLHHQKQQAWARPPPGPSSTTTTLPQAAGSQAVLPLAGAFSRSCAPARPHA